MFSRKTEKVINLKSVAIAFACLFLILNEISEMSQMFDSGKRVGYEWKPPGLISNSKEPLSHNKKRSILVGIHTMCVCVWDDKTWLIYCFSLTFNFLLHWEFELSCQRGKKLLGMRTGREKVKGGSWRPIFVMNELSSIYTQAWLFIVCTSQLQRQLVLSYLLK